MDTQWPWRVDPGPNPFSFGEFPNVGALHKNGEFVGGVHVGYNWQFAPTWVAGIEGDWSWTDAKASFTQGWVSTNPAVVRGPNALASLSLKENWLSTVRARVGYLVTPVALVYFTGGAAWGEFDYAASSDNEALTYVATSQFSKTAAGYVLGGGFEYAFWGNWSARAEYLYYHLSTTAATTVFDSTGNFRLHLPIRALLAKAAPISTWFERGELQVLLRLLRRSMLIRPGLCPPSSDSSIHLSRACSVGNSSRLNRQLAPGRTSFNRRFNLATSKKVYSGRWRGWFVVGAGT